MMDKRFGESGQEEKGIVLRENTALFQMMGVQRTTSPLPPPPHNEELIALPPLPYAVSHKPYQEVGVRLPTVDSYYGISAGIKGILKQLDTTEAGAQEMRKQKVKIPWKFQNTRGQGGLKRTKVTESDYVEAREETHKATNQTLAQQIETMVRKCLQEPAAAPLTTKKGFEKSLDTSGRPPAIEQAHSIIIEQKRVRAGLSAFGKPQNKSGYKYPSPDRATLMKDGRLHRAAHIIKREQKAANALQSHRSLASLEPSAWQGDEGLIRDKETEVVLGTNLHRIKQKNRIDRTWATNIRFYLERNPDERLYVIDNKKPPSLDLDQLSNPLHYSLRLKEDGTLQVQDGRKSWSLLTEDLRFELMDVDAKKVQDFREELSLAALQRERNSRPAFDEVEGGSW